MDNHMLCPYYQYYQLESQNSRGELGIARPLEILIYNYSRYSFYEEWRNVRSGFTKDVSSRDLLPKSGTIGMHFGDNVFTGPAGEFAYHSQPPYNFSFVIGFEHPFGSNESSYYVINYGTSVVTFNIENKNGPSVFTNRVVNGEMRNVMTVTGHDQRVAFGVYNLR